MRRLPPPSRTRATVPLALGLVIAAVGFSVLQRDLPSQPALFQAPPLLPSSSDAQPDHGRSVLPTDFVIDGSKEYLLYSQLDAGDREWQPRSIPIPGGGTRYTYKRLAGDPLLSLSEIKALILNPPSFAAERRAIRALLKELRFAGVRIVLGPPRKHGAAGEWEPRLKVLRIRPDVPGKGTREFARVLNHEAIHVSQSCRNGGVQSLPILLGLSRAVDPKQAAHLSAAISTWAFGY